MDYAYTTDISKCDVRPICGADIEYFAKRTWTAESTALSLPHSSALAVLDLCSVTLLDIALKPTNSKKRVSEGRRRTRATLSDARGRISTFAADGHSDVDVTFLEELPDLACLAQAHHFFSRASFRSHMQTAVGQSVVVGRRFALGPSFKPELCTHCREVTADRPSTSSKTTYGEMPETRRKRNTPLPPCKTGARH